MAQSQKLFFRTVVFFKNRFEFSIQDALSAFENGVVVSERMRAVLFCMLTVVQFRIQARSKEKAVSQMIEVAVSAAQPFEIQGLTESVSGAIGFQILGVLLAVYGI